VRFSKPITKDANFSKAQNVPKLLMAAAHSNATVTVNPPKCNRKKV